MREETKGDKEFNLLSVHICRVKQYIHNPLSMGINSRGGTRTVFDDVLRTKREKQKKTAYHEQWR